jgi:hypothetical protein
MTKFIQSTIKGGEPCASEVLPVDKHMVLVEVDMAGGGGVTLHISYKSQLACLLSVVT